MFNYFGQQRVTQRIACILIITITVLVLLLMLFRPVSLQGLFWAELQFIK